MFKETRKAEPGRKAKEDTMIPVLTLENRKTIYIDGHSITHDEAIEAARRLLRAFGNEFERKALDC